MTVIVTGDSTSIFQPDDCAAIENHAAENDNFILLMALALPPNLAVLHWYTFMLTHNVMWRLILTYASAQTKHIH